MHEILLVEDNEFFRTAIKSVLKKHGINVTEASDGKIAKSLIRLQTFDLVISDIQMPHLTGVELLAWINDAHPMPVVLMTGFANILETQEAYRLGASGFMVKPFREAEIMVTINKILKPKSTPSQEGDSEKEEAKQVYYKLAIEDFVVGNQIPFSIYINVGGTKYIKIAHSGESVPTQKIKTYMERNVRHLYIREEDFATLVGMNLKLTNTMRARSEIPMKVKQNFVKYTGEIILERAFISGIDIVGFRIAKDFVENSISLLCQDDDAFSALKLLNEHSDFIYAHSLGVSTYAAMVAKKIGWASPQTVFKLCIGGLFHDIGKKEIERSLLEKSRMKLNQQERKEVESHTVRGKAIAESIKNLPVEALHIIHEHHENEAGLGFPRGIRKERIHPFARLVNVVDVFCNYAIKTPISDGMSARDAIAKMELSDEHVIDSEFFVGLKKLAS